MKLSVWKQKLKLLEFKIFKFFLYRYCDNELDQWDLWKLKTKYGDVYLHLSRKPAPKTKASHYMTVYRNFKEYYADTRKIN